MHLRNAELSYSKTPQRNIKIASLPNLLDSIPVTTTLTQYNQGKQLLETTSLNKTTNELCEHKQSIVSFTTLPLKESRRAPTHTSSPSLHCKTKTLTNSRNENNAFRFVYAIPCGSFILFDEIYINQNEHVVF